MSIFVQLNHIKCNIHVVLNFIQLLTTLQTVNMRFRKLSSYIPSVISYLTELKLVLLFLRQNQF
jgi:hypothetical protein